MRRGSSVWAWVLLGAGAIAAGACITNDARDAHCTPSEPNPGARADCIYNGEGKGPQVVEEACPRVDGEAPATCPSFEDVYAILVDAERGGCTAGGCHGVEQTASVGIHISNKDPDDAYAALLEIEGSVGRPYVDADDPEASWIVCNLRGEPGGGFPMPVSYGLPDLADADVVRDWILCGAQGPEVCEPVEADGPCGACGRDRCCDFGLACVASPSCAPCAQCLQTGDRGSCAAECPDSDEAVQKLLACVGARCSSECPVEAK